jgi:hypothetical protein
LPEEIRIFIRSAGFGLVIATVYWFVSYEVAGTLLLLGFGIAGTFLAGTLVLELRSRGHRFDRRPWRWIGLDTAEENPLASEIERLPPPSVAPLLFGLGLAVAALAVVYGPGLVVAGLPLIMSGGVSWLRAISAEARAIAREER